MISELELIKIPTPNGPIEIDNPTVEFMTGIAVCAVVGCILYKFIKDDKPIMESIFGKKNTTE